MNPRLVLLLTLGLLLPGCVLLEGPVPAPTPAAENGSGDKPRTDTGTAGLLWVPGVSYRFNVTGADGSFKALRQYTVLALNTSTGAPCWEVLREEATPHETLGWIVGPPVRLLYNASTGALCGSSWVHDSGKEVRTVFQPEVVAFWPPADRKGVGDVAWTRSDGLNGTEVYVYEVKYEGSRSLTLGDVTFAHTEVFLTKLLTTGEVRQREEDRVWYSPQVGFFVKREHLADGVSEELVVNHEVVPGFSRN